MFYYAKSEFKPKEDLKDEVFPGKRGEHEYLLKPNPPF
jgi:hypothetical protein